MRQCTLVAVLCAFALETAGQQASSSRPDDPATATSAAGYQSALQGYTAYREEVLRPWREVNDEVARIGGHVGIVTGAGPAQAERTQPSDAESTPAKPAGQMHREMHKPNHPDAMSKPAGPGHKGH